MGLPPRSMVYLYVLLVLSLAALLWAVWAITKHVRKQAAEGNAAADAEELEGAAASVEASRAGTDSTKALLQTSRAGHQEESNGSAP